MTENTKVWSWKNPRTSMVTEVTVKGKPLCPRKGVDEAVSKGLLKGLAHLIPTTTYNTY